VSSSRLFHRQNSEKKLERAVSAGALRLINLPRSFPVSLLNENGRLLSKEEVAIAEKFQSNPNSPGLDCLAKADTGLNYEILFNSGTLYAVYDVPLGKGTFGTAKLVQDQKTGDLRILKEANDPDVSLADEHQKLVEINKANPEPLKNKNGVLMDYESGFAIGEIYDWEGERGEYVLRPISRIHLAVEIVRTYINQLYDFGKVHCDINENNVVTDLAQQRAGFIDAGPILPIGTEAYLQGTPVYVPLEIRQKVLEQFRRRNAGEDFFGTAIYDLKTESYSLAILLAQLLYLIDMPYENDVLAYPEDETFLISPDNVQDYWEVKLVPFFKELLSILQDATKKNVDERITPYDMLPRLEKVERDFLSMMKTLDSSKLENISFREPNVQLFDVDLYLSLSEPEQIEMLKSANEKADEIILVDSKKQLLASQLNEETNPSLERNMKVYLEIKSKLESISTDSMLALRVVPTVINADINLKLIKQLEICDLEKAPEYRDFLEKMNQKIQANIEERARTFLESRSSIPFKMSWNKTAPLVDIMKREFIKAASYPNLKRQTGVTLS